MYTGSSSSEFEEEGVIEKRPPMPLSLTRSCLKVKTQQNSLGGIIPEGSAEPEEQRDIATLPLKIGQQHGASKKLPMEKKCISFGNVDLRLYPVVLSENPGSGGNGPSLELGWIYEPCGKLQSLDRYEQSHERRYQERDDMIIAPEERRKLLERIGYTNHQIMMGTIHVKCAKRDRWETIELTPRQERLQEEWEKLWRNAWIPRKLKQMNDKTHIWTKSYTKRKVQQSHYVG
jgi:hypothetical protein